MAKKARKKASKKAAVKRKRTKTKISKARKTSRPAVKKSKSKKKTTKAKRSRKPKRQTFGQRIASAFSVVSDTISGTDKMRNKLEPPATSETE